MGVWIPAWCSSCAASLWHCVQVVLSTMAPAQVDGPSRCPPDSSEFCHGLCLQFSNMWSVPKQQGTGNGPLLAIPRSNRVPHQFCTEFCAGFHCKYTDDCFCHTWENDCFCSDNMHKHPGWVGKFLSSFHYLGNPLSWSPDSPQVLLFEPRESGIFVIEPAVRVSKLELRLMD